jgi:hypothetical protein
MSLPGPAALDLFLGLEPAGIAPLPLLFLQLPDSLGRWWGLLVSLIAWTIPENDFLLRVM